MDARQIIKDCAETFRQYERNHRAKAVRLGTSADEVPESHSGPLRRQAEDSRQKAEVNRTKAEMCEAWLAQHPEGAAHDHR